MSFGRTAEKKFLARSTLFSPKSVPTLKESSSIALIEELGTIEKVEEFIKQNPLPGLYDHILSILPRIKKLHEYVIDNNVEAADEFLNATPYYLLPVLLKTKSIVQTSAKGTHNHIFVEGTALMMAIGAEAVGRAGCDLCLIPFHSQKENTVLKRLALYSDDDPDSPLCYRVKDKEFIIERGNLARGVTKEQLHPMYFNKLKKMFKNPFLYNKNLNLDHLALSEAQREAYAFILEITKKRGHTLFVKEEGMIELLQRHIRRAFSNDGELEIERQTLNQLSDRYEEKAETEYVNDFKMLRKIRKAIADSISDQDPRLITAFDAFRDYFEPKANVILASGKYGKSRLFVAALEIGDKEHFGNYRKDNLWYNQIVGWLEGLMQHNVKQDMAQGFNLLLYGGRKSNRSLKYTFGDVLFVLAEDPRSGIGFNSLVNFIHGEEQKGDAGKAHWQARIFKEYLQEKASMLQKIIPQLNMYPRKKCRCIRL